MWVSFQINKDAEGEDGSADYKASEGQSKAHQPHRHQHHLVSRQIRAKLTIQLDT